MPVEFEKSPVDVICSSRMKHQLMMSAVQRWSNNTFYTCNGGNICLIIFDENTHHALPKSNFHCCLLSVIVAPLEFWSRLKINHYHHLYAVSLHDLGDHRILQSHVHLNCNHLLTIYYSSIPLLYHIHTRPMSRSLKAYLC